jgi:hypothetical protein
MLSYSGDFAAPDPQLALDCPVGLAIDSVDDPHVACHFNGKILKFDSSGNRSDLASGLVDPTYIAIRIPEPSTWALLILGAVTLFGGTRFRRSQS